MTEKQILRICDAKAKLLEQNYTPKILRLTPQDYIKLKEECRATMGLNSDIEVCSYLDLEVFVDATITQSQIHAALPYWWIVKRLKE